MSARSERITFDGHAGELAARLDLPAGTPRAFALFAHCFTCSKDLFAARRIAGGLTDHGIGVLRFDFTGLGASDGEFANTNFSTNVEDLIHAAAFLRDTHDAPAILIGHSLGGAAVLAAAGDIPEAQAVATIGAPFDPAHALKEFGASLGDIKRDGEAKVSLAGRSFTIKKHFIDDLNAQAQGERIAKLRKALLIFHAPTDEIVGIENAGQIFAAAKHPKSFISLDSADHLISRHTDACYIANVLTAWAGRYALPTPAMPKVALRAGGGATLVVERNADAFTQDIDSAGHRLVADEPLDQGGDNLGPGPYDLLLAALGACTAMTLRLYANHKKLPLERVAVRLSHDKIHAKDCADCETREGKIDKIVREIEIIGELSDDQRGRMLEIADKCPVHRTLKSEVKVETRAAG